MLDLEALREKFRREEEGIDQRERAHTWYLLGVAGKPFAAAWEDYYAPIREAKKAAKEQRKKEYDQMYPPCPKCKQNKCGQDHLGHPDYDGYCSYCTCKCNS